MFRATCLSFLLLCAASAARADGTPDWLSLGWLLFGDAYHVASHHTQEGEGATGLVIRRGYLTFDADWSGPWSTRMRFELNQDGEFESYDFEVDFKDLYLQREIGRQKLLLGLSPTPTYDLIEGIWGKRYLMRTPMDLQGVASRDTGIALRGPLGAGERWGYRAMVGTGIEFGNESEDGAKFMLGLNFHPAPGWTLDLYVDREELPGRRDRRTVQGFVGYQDERWRLGAQYSDQDRQEDEPLELASLFAVRRLNKRWELIGRVDRIIKPSPEGDNISYIPFDPSAPATMWLAGLESRLNDHVRLTPNVIYTHYDRDDEGSRPDPDLHLRLTLFIDFE